MAAAQQPMLNPLEIPDFSNIFIGFNGLDDKQSRSSDLTFDYDFSWILSHFLTQGSKTRSQIELGDIETRDDLENKISLWFKEEYDPNKISYDDLSGKWGQQLYHWLSDQSSSLAKTSKHRVLRYTSALIMLDILKGIFPRGSNQRAYRPPQPNVQPIDELSIASEDNDDLESASSRIGDENNLLTALNNKMNKLTTLVNKHFDDVNKNFNEVKEKLDNNMEYPTICCQDSTENHQGAPSYANAVKAKKLPTAAIIVKATDTLSSIVDKKLSPKQIVINDYDSVYEDVIVECNLDNHKILLINLYKPPHLNSSQIKIWCQHLQKIIKHYNQHSIYISGDVNATAISWSSDCSKDPIRKVKALVAPDKHFLLSINASTAVIHSDSWHAGGCPIDRMEIMFKEEKKKEWFSHPPVIFLPSKDEKDIILSDLRPGTSYELKITAKNEAGPTTVTHIFRTNSLARAEKGPFMIGNEASKSASDSSPYSELNLILPTIISIGATFIVLSFLICLIFLKRRHNNINFYGEYMSV